MRSVDLGIRAIGLVGFLVFVVAAYTSLPNLLNAWMGGVARLERADAIVVLGRGGADSDGVLTNRSLRRLIHGIRLYRETLAPLLVLSGSADEAKARAVLAQGFGVPVDAIVQVASARTTQDEADHIAQILLPRGQRRILLVGDPIDMPRASAVMKRVGFTVLPAPTAATGPSLPEGRLALFRDVATELVGIAYYRVTGKL